ncbi:MAG TPA: hypothetical protein DCY88_13840 [Cyanobacteria bacterium UBA11372]|nr:hypothetical protein [Cyanobacteria bacterium UBA11372]
MKVTQLPLEIVRSHEAKPLDAADTIAIHELINRVFLAEDSRDREALQQTVTEDFVQEHTIFGKLTGRETFASWVIDNPEFFDGIRHMAGNIVVSGDGIDRAQAVSYIYVFQLFSDIYEASNIPRILAHGIVRDRLIKENGRWKIAHRIYDQFAVQSEVVPDAKIREQASQAIDAK